MTANQAAETSASDLSGLSAAILLAWWVPVFWAVCLRSRFARLFMAINVALTHKTHYHYDRLISLGPQVVRLRPAPHCRTPILSYSLKVRPEKHFINWQQDPQSNYLARLVFPDPTTEFFVEVDLVAAMGVFNPFDFFLEPSADECPFTYEPILARELRPYLELEPAGPRLTELLASVPRTRTRTIDFLVGLNQRVKEHVGYVIRLEPGVQTCEETLQLRAGSCRDSAWLLVVAMRHLGLAARFVSGYLIQLQADVKPLEGPSGPTSDFTDLHAWAEVYLPGAGWIGFDPTSGLLAGEGHIPLACTPYAVSAAPITGMLDPCNTEFSHQMTVRRIYESPRVTKPYTDQQWRDIEALGHSVDAKLRAGDVRLTIGGEPTFVSLDDADGDEWTRDALGPAKRKLAVELLNKLRDYFAPHALLHYGQGKWYPGELLPRWALSCFWRADRVPVWEDTDLIALEDHDYGFATGDALRFIQALTRRLQVTAENVLPAFDPESESGNESTEPAGYILPIRRRQSNGLLRWSSQWWFPPVDRVVLFAGDSPVGYRIPTEAIPWVAPDDLEYDFDDA